MVKDCPVHVITILKQDQERMEIAFLAPRCDQSMGGLGLHLRLLTFDLPKLNLSTEADSHEQGIGPNQIRQQHTYSHI